MPVIWAAISGHGFGHAAQVIPVLNELGKRVPGLVALLRTTVPASFFQDRLTIPWTLQCVQQDVGCIQNGPLRIDVTATWEAHKQFHERYDEKVAQEVAAMRLAGPQVVLADTPYLAIFAASKAGVPAVGLANFTWNEILAPLAEPHRSEEQSLLIHMEQSYGAAQAGIRLAPGLTLSAFRQVTDAGPISDPAVPRRQELREWLRVPQSESLVLIGFGGIPLSSLPWQAIDGMRGYRFVVDGAVPASSSKIVSLATLPYRFKTVLASVDIVMTKPGYGTVIEAVVTGVAVLYVRRFNFADEAPLVNFLRQYGRARELSLEDFENGTWEEALGQVAHLALPTTPPSCTGAQEAAAFLARYF